MSAHRKNYGLNETLPSFDSFFTTEAQRQDSKLERITPLPVEMLYPFKEHPYSVLDDDDMDELVTGVKDRGVKTPITVRSRAEGGYEIISGHRRVHAALIAGLTEVPAIVREMDDDEAIIEMVDSNQQRSHIRPTEKARAYQMKLEAVKRKAGRPSKNNLCQVGTDLLQPRSDVAVAKSTPESARTVQRYIRLNELIPELKEMVDAQKLKFNPAVEISYLKPEEQQEFCEFIQSQEITPTLSQAQRLKAASREENFTQDLLEQIMTSVPTVKPREMRVTLEYCQLEKFFPKNVTPEQIVAQIIRLLEAQYRSRQRDHRGER